MVLLHGVRRIQWRVSCGVWSGAVCWRPVRRRIRALYPSSLCGSFHWFTYSMLSFPLQTTNRKLRNDWKRRRGNKNLSNSSGTAFESLQLTILQTRLHFVCISEYIVMRCSESSWPFNVYWLQNYSRRRCRWIMWITIIRQSMLSKHHTDSRNHMRQHRAHNRNQWHQKIAKKRIIAYNL